MMKMTSPVSLSIWIQVPVMTVILSPLNGLKSSSKTSDPVSHYAVLESFARKDGLKVRDVLRGGNSLFSSVAYQLQHMGHDVNLRQMVVSYLSENGDVYSPFVHQSVASNDGYNADNEAHGEEDAYIESITDPEV